MVQKEFHFSCKKEIKSVGVLVIFAIVGKYSAPWCLDVLFVGLHVGKEKFTFLEGGVEK